DTEVALVMADGAAHQVGGVLRQTVGTGVAFPDFLEVLERERVAFPPVRVDVLEHRLDEPFEQGVKLAFAVTKRRQHFSIRPFSPNRNSQTPANQSKSEQRTAYQDPLFAANA